jgi:hypothetical protein
MDNVTNIYYDKLNLRYTTCWWLVNHQEIYSLISTSQASLHWTTGEPGLLILNPIAEEYFTRPLLPRLQETALPQNQP